MNKWIREFIFNREPPAVQTQNDYYIEHKSSTSFSLCSHTHMLCTYVWEEILVDLETEYQQNKGLFHYRLTDATKANMTLTTCQFAL